MTIIIAQTTLRYRVILPGKDKQPISDLFTPFHHFLLTMIIGGSVFEDCSVDRRGVISWPTKVTTSESVRKSYRWFSIVDRDRFGGQSGDSMSIEV